MTKADMLSGLKRPASARPGSVRPGSVRPARARPAWARIAVIAAIAGGGYAAWLSLHSRPISPTVQHTQPGIPITVGTVVQQDLDVWFSAIGTVKPLNVVDVKVRVDGQLQSVVFQEGQDVTAGQVLAQIDPRPYQAALQQTQAAERKDRAQFANAQAEVARASKLASAGAGTTQSLETVRAQQATLAATLDADEAAIDAAELNLSFTKVTSPLTGRVGMRQVDAGAIVHASDAAGIVTVTQMQPISALFSLPQDQLDAVLDGQAKGPLRVSVETRDGGKHITDGKLTFVNSTIDPLTGQIQLKGEFANTDRRLWPGEFVSVRVLARTDKAVMTIPAQAVLSGQNGFYVYVVKPDHTVTPQDVTVGATVSNVTEIRSGLSAGQTVAIDGQSRLGPGTKVTYNTAAQ